MMAQSPRRQRLYPVVDHDQKLVGVVTRHELQHLMQQGNGHGLAELIRRDPKVAYPDEPLRVVVYRMAETGLTRFPVVERDGSRKLVGMVSLDDLLKARAHTLDAERRRERVLPLRLMFPIEMGETERGVEATGLSRRAFMRLLLLVKAPHSCCGSRNGRHAGCF